MDRLTLQTIRDTFAKEISAAAERQPSSLPFIKHILPELPLISDNTLFQVAVIGGSIFRYAIIQKQGHNYIILRSDEKPLQPIKEKEQFFETLESLLDPAITTMAINFAYPLEPVLRDNKLDGVLVRGTKEHAFKGLVGEQIGSVIENHLGEKFNQQFQIAVANDAICALLSGLTVEKKQHLAGCVMGTGTNITLFHDGSAVNLESANFDKFTPSETCVTIDKHSTHPGTALFEKETAGAYLYQHYNLLLQQQPVAGSPVSSTEELAHVVEQDPGSPLAKLGSDLFERSASLLAAQLAGVGVFKQSPMKIVVEGTFFWKNDLYREFVERYLQQLSAEFPVTVIKVENSPIMGAAKLVA